MQRPPDPLYSPPPAAAAGSSGQPCTTGMQAATTATLAAPQADRRHEALAPACTSLVQLTLAAPRHLEEDLVDQLLAHPDWATGFTLMRAEGHSHLGQTLTTQERVRGRADRISVQIVLERGQALTLLAHLKHHLPKRDVAYWLTPVLEFGRLA